MPDDVEGVMRKVLFASATVFAAVAAQAAPGSFVNLGTIISTTGVYGVPDRAVGVDLVGSTIQWFRFDFVGGTAPSGAFLDIDLFATGAVNTPAAPDTEIGIYDNFGARIANDDDDGHSLRSALTFGNTTARTMPADPFGFTGGVAHNGRDGNLAPGTYWLAVGLFDTTFGATNWAVTSNATGTGTTVVNFRTDAVPEPATMAVLGLGVAALLRRRRA